MYHLGLCGSLVIIYRYTRELSSRKDGEKVKAGGLVRYSGDTGNIIGFQIDGNKNSKKKKE